MRANVLLTFFMLATTAALPTVAHAERCVPITHGGLDCGSWTCYPASKPASGAWMCWDKAGFWSTPCPTCDSDRPAPTTLDLAAPGTGRLTVVGRDEAGAVLFDLDGSHVADLALGGDLDEAASVEWCLADEATGAEACGVEEGRKYCRWGYHDEDSCIINCTLPFLGFISCSCNSYYCGCGDGNVYGSFCPNA